MTFIHFQQPLFLLGLILVPLLALLFGYATRQRVRAARAFGAIPQAGRKRDALGVCIAVALLAIALARPSWGIREKELLETGRDVIFVLDVSRSMLADDLFPNRLESAKMAILDCTESFAGDRVALLLFAGSAEIRCPLTTDYAYFRMALRQASPESVSAGGTQLANALEKVMHKLIQVSQPGMLDVILISDGEEMQTSPEKAEEAARKLGAAGARLICIGVGDPERGSRIVLHNPTNTTTHFLMHDGKAVWTHLHAKTLRSMAEAADGGVYFEVASDSFNLTKIYREVMQNAPKTAAHESAIEEKIERFFWFIGAALVMLFLFRTGGRK